MESNIIIAEKYKRRVIEQHKSDQYIKMYDTMINQLEICITILLNEYQRKVIIIYANYPGNGQSNERENVALEKGYSRENFYRITNKSFEILNTVLESHK